LHSRHFVDSLVANIRWFHDVVFVVYLHQSILLVSYLRIFRKISTWFAFITGHHELISILSSGWAHLIWWNICITAILIHAVMTLIMVYSILGMSRFILSESICLSLLWNIFAISTSTRMDIIVLIIWIRKLYFLLIQFLLNELFISKT
jgi:hypothetical protein